jgi:hypothetical protein
MKDIKANFLVLALFPDFLIGIVGVNILHTDFVEN